MKKKIQDKALRWSHSHPIGWNLVIWSHLAARDSGKCSLEQMSLCLGDIVKRIVNTEVELGGLNKMDSGL